MAEETAKHASLAEEVLAFYTPRVHDGKTMADLCEDDQEDVVLDLIADLLHAAHKRELDTDHILEQARLHFTAEVQEDR